MCDSFLPVHILLENSVLVNAYCGKDIKDLFIHIVNAIEYETDDDLLPCRAADTPELRFLQVDDIPDVLHDSVKCACQKSFVLVVICDSNEKLSVSTIHARAEIVPVGKVEVVWVAGSSCVSQLGEFFIVSTLVVSILRQDGVDNRARHRVICTENRSLDQFDSARLRTLDACFPNGMLSLYPSSLGRCARDCSTVGVSGIIVGVALLAAVFGRRRRCVGGIRLGQAVC